MLTETDLAALWITLKLAGLTTLILLLLGTPLAWWLARTRFRGKVIVEDGEYRGTKGDGRFLKREIAREYLK